VLLPPQHGPSDEPASSSPSPARPSTPESETNEAVGASIRGGKEFHWRLSASDPGPDPCCRWSLIVIVGLVLLIALARGVPSLFDGGAWKVLHTASSNTNIADHAPSWAIWVAVLIGVACGLASAVLVRSVLELSQGAIVTAGVYGTIALLGLLAILSLVQLQIAATMLLILIGGCLYLVPWCCPARVKFAEAFVAVATTVVGDFPGLFVAATAAIGVQVLFLFCWGLAVLGIAALTVSTGRFQNEDPAVATLVGLSSLVLFVSVFWVTGTVSNLVAVATARITALWYISGREGDPETMAVAADGIAMTNPSAKVATSGPAIRRQLAGGTAVPIVTREHTSDDWKTAGRPVYQASIWASTAALGPVAFGSLVVALVQMLRMCCSRDDDNLAAACCGFILDMIERMLRYYNSYVYAVLGTAKDPKQTLSFTRAAGVVNTITVSGSAVSAIFNDWLIDFGVMLCTVLAALVSLVLGLVSGALFGLAMHSELASATVLGIAAVVGVLVGLLATTVLLGLVTGSVKALFVIWVASVAILPSSDRSRPTASLGAAVESSSPAPRSDLELVAMRHGPGRVTAVKQLEQAWQARVDSDQTKEASS
jgi:hypothetical protein